MKKLFITVLVLAVLGVGFYYGYQKATSYKTTSSIKDTEVIQVPTEVSMEVRKVFGEYQQLCKSGDIEALIDACDLLTMTELYGENLQTMRATLREQFMRKDGRGNNAPTIMDMIANAEFKSISPINLPKEIRKKLKLSQDESLMKVTVVMSSGDLWDLNFHKTMNGWKLLSQKNMSGTN